MQLVDQKTVASLGGTNDATTREWLYTRSHNVDAMRFYEDDRVRVTRVRIECQGEFQEIPGCWIAVNPDRNEIGVWLARDDSEPVATASLDQTIIEWPDFMMPGSP